MPSQTIQGNGGREVPSQIVTDGWGVTRSLRCVPIAMGAAAAILLSACACGGESEWVPPSMGTQAAYTRGVWVGRAGEPVYSPEAPSKVHIFPGRTVGYQLTSETPGSYRFRWTSDQLVSHSGFRRFHGSVWTPGHFLSVVPGCDDGSCALEDNDYVSRVERVAAGGERIEWNTLASDGWDGFSFKTDAEPIYFEVNVDGDARPDAFEYLSSSRPREIGAIGVAPSAGPPF